MSEAVESYLIDIGVYLLIVTGVLFLVSQMIPRKYLFTIDPKVLSKSLTATPWFDIPSHMLNRTAKNIRKVIISMAVLSIFLILGGSCVKW